MEFAKRFWAIFKAHKEWNCSAKKSEHPERKMSSIMFFENNLFRKLMIRKNDRDEKIFYLSDFIAAWSVLRYRRDFTWAFLCFSNFLYGKF